MRGKSLLVASAGALLLSACGSASQQASIAQSPQLAQAQKVVQGCVTQSNFITAQGRQAFVRCISPPGKQAQVEQCVQAKVASDGFLTAAARTKLEQDAAGCIV